MIKNIVNEYLFFLKFFEKIKKIIFLNVIGNEKYRPCKKPGLTENK